MKKFLTIAILLIISIGTFSQEYENKLFPYLKTSMKYVKPPASFDDALKQLDVILKDEIINHFKKEDELIGSIKISQELGAFFINYWKLRYNFEPGNISKKYANDSSPLVKTFYEYDINNPYLIIRTLFGCYHKKINNKEFSLVNEIEKIYKEYSSECIVDSYREFWDSEKRIMDHEESLLFAEKVNQFSVNDTVGKRFYEKNRESVFYITASIKEIDITNNKITVQVFDIVSDKRYRKVIYKGGYLQVDATLVEVVDDWLKYGVAKFDYRTGSYRHLMPSWDKYIKRKYNGN